MSLTSSQREKGRVERKQEQKASGHAIINHPLVGFIQPHPAEVHDVEKLTFQPHPLYFMTWTNSFEHHPLYFMICTNSLFNPTHFISWCGQILLNPTQLISACRQTLFSTTTDLQMSQTWLCTWIMWGSAKYNVSLLTRDSAKYNVSLLREIVQNIMSAADTR